MISVDIETYDPELLDKGPGVYRKDGELLGVGMSYDDGKTEYINVGHRFGVDRRKPNAAQRAEALARIERILGTDEPKVGTNLLYDMDWLTNGYDIKVGGKWNDIQIAAPLLDEYRYSYSLDSLAQDMLGVGKDVSGIQQFCDKYELKGDPRKHLYLMPYELVAKYVATDTEAPRKIFEIQSAQLEEQGLIDVYNMEIGLLPLLLDMRRNGVRLDKAKHQQAADVIAREVERVKRELFAEYGPFNHRSTADVVAIFDRLGLSYDRTKPTDRHPNGQPSVTKQVIEQTFHPFARNLLHLKECDTTLNNFILGAFNTHNVDGRIHCQFLPLKRDEGGTVSGRFSSQNPNLQQIPGRDENDRNKGKSEDEWLEGALDLGKLCRDIFIPEDDCWYGKVDFSQVEYRIIAHYARGPKSEEIKRQYNEDPTTDYHKLVMSWTGVNRPTAKRLNFGMAYFMGARSMSRKFGWPLEEAERLVELYFDTVPFLQPTRAGVVDVARGRGYIRTIMGRRARVSDYINENKKHFVMFNRLIQGSAADVMKKAMLDAYNQGLFNVLVPHLTVHDELGVSVPKTVEGVEAYKELKHCMENCIALRVPLVAEADIGPSWGTKVPFDYEACMKEVGA